jgi:WD40 repeat protein
MQIDRVHHLRIHTNTVWDAKYSPDGRKLATSAWDRTIKVLETKSWAILFSLEDFKYTSVICWHPTRDMLLSVGDGGIYLWSGIDGKKLELIPLHHIRHVDWLNEDVFVCGNHAGRLFVYVSFIGGVRWVDA